jgi:hypothetical protein
MAPVPECASRIRMSRPRVPYLSLVLTGRNDNFGGDFNERLFAAVAYNHHRLAAAGVNYELVFVEWRPVPGRPLLADLLREHVPELGSRLTTYEVDERYHDAFSQNPRLQFHEFIAKNVGIRRAVGSYLLATNTDIYLSHDLVCLIARQTLRPMVLYRATRVDLKSGLDTTNLDEDVLADGRNHAAVNNIRPPFFTNASGDFLLLDRYSFQALKGFNEVFRAAKLLVDANFCYHAAAQGLLLVDTGLPVYHFGEGTFQTQRAQYKNTPGGAPWGGHWRKEVLYDNPASWGLRDAPMSACGRGHFRLEFDDRAVPPLVALAGVTRPVTLARG